MLEWFDSTCLQHFGKSSKCEFHVSSVSFLGFAIEQWQLKADPEKIQAVLDWPAPANHKQLQRFLGIVYFTDDLCRTIVALRAP